MLPVSLNVRVTPPEEKKEILSDLKRNIFSKLALLGKNKKFSQTGFSLIGKKIQFEQMILNQVRFTQFYQ